MQEEKQVPAQTQTAEKKDKRWGGGKASAIAVVTVIFLLIGFGITLQIRSVSQNQAQAQSPEILRAETLQKDVNALQEQNKDLETQLARARADLDEIRNAAGDTDKTAEILRQQLEQTERFAGLTELSGPGVVVTVHDKHNPGADASVSPEKYMVHEEDLMKIINELRDAGAEAISVNGERVVAMSEIRCAGSTVSINNNRYNAPFVITAVGKAEDLNYALTMRKGVVDLLTPYIDVKVQVQTNVTVPAYVGSTDLRVAD